MTQAAMAVVVFLGWDVMLMQHTEVRNTDEVGNTKSGKTGVCNQWCCLKEHGNCSKNGDHAAFLSHKNRHRTIGRRKGHQLRNKDELSSASGYHNVTSATVLKSKPVRAL